MTEPDSIRLDIAVQEKLGNISRATATKLIEAGKVRVNSKDIAKASFKVRPGDKIDVNYDLNETVIPKIKLKVIFEDQDVIVVDKPTGLLTHSKGNFNDEATVATWLADKYTGPNGDRAGIVHRLDRLTSGVMICAKNEESTKWLQKQFSKRRVKKTYIAIVSGHLNHDQAIIDLPIERNPKAPQSFRVGASGKSAQTEYELLESNDHFSVLELKPTTGRTHQLRVHLAHLGHSIVGDSVYKGVKADRLYLHAKRLEITLPSKNRAVFESPLPKEFKLFMKDHASTN